MNFKAYKDIEYSGEYHIVGEYENNEIILLKFNHSHNPRDNGRRNLLCIDKDSKEIIWIVEAPEMAKRFQIYCDVKIYNEYDYIEAWYGGSVRVYINKKDGTIIKEDFIK